MTKINMKIILTWVLCTAISCGAINFAVAQKLKLGVTVTPTASILSTSDELVQSDGGSLGIVYGLMADYQFSENERYALFTGFTVHHTAGKFKSALEQYKVAVTILEIPAIFKLNTNQVNLKSYYGQFGFNFGVPISHKTKEGPEDNVNVVGVLAAINIGAGMHYELVENGVMLNLGLYFDNGFTSIYKIEGQQFRLKHIGLRAGVYF